MLAPDLQSVYQFEYFFDRAASLVVSSSLINAGIPRNSNINQYPLVNVKFSLGEPTGHLQITSNGVRQDSFKGSLAVQVITDRSLNGSLHSTLTGYTRAMCVDPSFWNTDGVLYYHGVADVGIQSTNTQVDNDNNLDITETTYDMTVCILPDAWPNGVTPPPTGSAQPAREGSTAYDDDYYYVYTNGQWKRTPIETWS